jgi:hypothetical protein
MDYTIITRNGESYVSCTCHNGHYYELPVIYKADGTEDHDKIAEAIDTRSRVYSNCKNAKLMRRDFFRRCD